MSLHTVIAGISKGLTEPLLDMQHLVFCLLATLVLFTVRKKPRDLWYYVLGLIPGYYLERSQPFPPARQCAGATDSCRCPPADLDL